MSNRQLFRPSALTTLFVALLVALFLGIASQPAGAQAVWRPSCDPLIPPACSDVGDGTAGAVISFHHNYPTAILSGGGAIYTDPYGRPALAEVIGHPTSGPATYDGEAGAHCSSGLFMSMAGCTTGPAAPQGRPQCKVGDPINVISGNHYESVTDFTTIGSEALALTRSYNSDLNFVISVQAAYSAANAPYHSRFGNAWRNNFDTFISALGGLSGASEVDAYMPDGNPAHFRKSGGVWFLAYWDPVSQGWSSAPRSDLQLKISTDGTYWYIADSSNTVFKYDNNGKVVLITYRGGYALSFTYDGSGNNTVITDTFSRTLTFTYLANGLVDTVTDPTGGITQYSYVDRSQIGITVPSGTGIWWALSQVTYPDGKSVQYLYEDTNLNNRYALTGIIDENGNRYATWSYDATTGRTLSSQHAGGADLTTISYDDVHNTRTVTNALGKQAIYNLTAFQGTFQITSIDGQASTHCPASTVSYLYDSNGFVSQTTSAEGRVNSYTNNSIGQETSRTEGYGSGVARTVTTTWNSTWWSPDQIVEPNITTDLTYDGSGRLSQRKLTDTTTTIVPYSTNGQIRTWDYTYYGNGLLHTVDGPLSGSGDTTTYTYDSSGCVASITDVLSHTTTISSSNGWCAPLVSSDANGVTTNYAYDLRGRLTSVTVNPGASQAVYGFTYDYAGNLTVVTLPDSSTLTYGYDNAHRLTSIVNTAGERIEYTLDDLGDITQNQIKTSGGTIKKTQTATFDELGRMLTSIGAASQTTQYTYDKDNNQVSLTDPRSKVYGYAFDALNRLYQQTDPGSYQTTSAFNAQDDALSVTDARSLVTSYVRDGFGDIIRQTSPDTGITDFWYDTNGAVVKTVDARGVETDFTNDNLGRVLTKTFPAASAENASYVYDSTASGNKGVGHLTSMTDQSGSKAFVINALGQTTTQTDVIGSNPYGIAYTYDPAGNVLTETFPSGRIVTYTRDTTGRIASVTTKQNSGASAVNVATSVGYMPFGPLSGFTFGNGIVLALSYDQDYQLTGINAASGGTVVQDITNGFDAAGNITGITDNHTSSRSQTITYENLNRVASASGAYGAQSYTYDGVGNRLTRVLGGVTDTYAYSMSANQIATITTGANVRSFTYSASGQVSTDTRDASHAYAFTINNDGRNAAATLNSSGVGSYVYNGFEQRAQKVAGSSTIQFTYDISGHLIAEANSTGTVQREYIWIDNLPVAMVDATSGSPVLYFIHTDQLGTPQKITDGSKNVVWDGLFDPFGNGSSVLGSNWGAVNWGSFNWGSGGGFLNQLRFPGQYADSETALNQNWFRDYDPSIGRYLQVDPADNNVSIASYDYANQSPLTWTDTSGLAPKDKTYGLPNDFWKWYHRKGKDAGMPDLSKEDADQEYEQWCREGKPKSDSKGKRSDEPKSGDSNKFQAPTLTPYQKSRLALAALLGAVGALAMAAAAAAGTAMAP